MSDAEILDIAQSAFMVALKVAGPILVVALVIGVLISLFQTVTQIQEMTLTFVPKLIGTGLVVLLAGKWMLGELVSWMQGLWSIIPSL